jgi:hypothetical protein
MQGGIKLVKHDVAADVSRLKLLNFARVSCARRKIMIRLTPDATKKGEVDAVLWRVAALSWTISLLLCVLSSLEGHASLGNLPLLRIQ